MLHSYSKGVIPRPPWSLLIASRYPRTSFESLAQPCHYSVLQVYCLLVKDCLTRGPLHCTLILDQRNKEKQMTIVSLDIYCNEIARTKSTQYLSAIRAQLQGLLKSHSISLTVYQGLNRDIRDRSDWLNSRRSR